MSGVASVPAMGAAYLGDTLAARNTARNVMVVPTVATTTSSSSDELGPPERVVSYALCRGNGCGCPSPIRTASSGVVAVVSPVNDGVVSTPILTATVTSSVPGPSKGIMSVPATVVGPTVDIVSSLSTALNSANTALVDPPGSGPCEHVLATALADTVVTAVMSATPYSHPCKDTL